MKNLLKFNSLGLFITLCFSFFFLTSCEKSKVVDETELPTSSQRFILEHFPGSRIIQVDREIDDLKLTYEVYLDSGYELEFNRKGENISIKSNRNQAIPSSAIPARISQYVQSEFPDLVIVEWELETTTQEIKLSNGMELVFSKTGEFIRIDN